MAEKKVVLVAGEKSPLQSVTDALKKGGYEVASCKGGFDALSRLVSEGADILISATDLSDLSGYRLSCLIKSTDRTNGLPVVLIETAGNGKGDFWKAAAQADQVLSAKELKGGEDKFLKLLEGLIEKGKQGGWASRKTKGAPVLPGQFSSADLVASYGSLTESLLVERVAIRIVRSIMTVVEPRKKFIENYFAQLKGIFDLPLVGFALAGTNSPWAAFQLSGNVSKRSFNDISAKMAKQLEIHKEFSMDLRGDLKEEGGKEIQTFEVFPIKSERATLGGLIFGSTDKTPFDDLSREAMAHLQAHMLPVMKLLIANQEIESLYQREQYRASTDPLTGLYNLEFLVGFLQQQLLFSYRQRSPVGLLIVDIDNFKEINDDSGYEIGDLVLSTIANKMLNQTRSSDLIARYGGDEFAVILPNTDLNGAKVLAEKVRLEIEQTTFVKGQGRKGPKVTVSIGCAAFNMEDLNPETILRDAKMALARAKDGGRNRVAS